MVDVSQKQLQDSESQPSAAGLTIWHPKPVTTALPWRYDDNMTSFFQSKVLNLLYYFIVYFEHNMYLNCPLC